MSESEDDFMSDKFLHPEASTSNSKPRDYASIRREAQRQSELKQLENKARHVSRRERERAAREEGLSKNLISEARISEEGKPEPQNKALDMMRKMGFKPGQSLGKQSANQPTQNSSQPEDVAPVPSEQDESNPLKRRAVPLEIHMREGRGGLGTEKPSSKRQKIQFAEKTAKSQDQYKAEQRSRADDRKAAARLRAAQRTCRELDLRKGGKEKGNVLWLDPDEAAKEQRRKVHAIRMGERAIDDPDDALIYGDIEIEIPDEERDDWFALDVRALFSHPLVMPN